VRDDRGELELVDENTGEVIDMVPAPIAVVSEQRLVLRGETCQSAFAGGGSQRRSCAGGGSHVRQLGRRRSAPLDMAGCRAATRSW
jgi:hypothetical protein